MSTNELMSASQADRKYQARLFGQFIIKNGFQFKFSLMIIAALGVSVLLMWYWTHASIARLISSEAIVSPEAKEQLLLMESIVLKFGVLMTAGTLFMSLIFTHKIAGPIYRFEKTMEDLRDGNLSVYVRLRPKDEFHDTAELFNQAIVSLRNKVQKERELTKATAEKLKLIIESLKVAGRTNEATQLEAIFNEIKSQPPQIKI